MFIFSVIFRSDPFQSVFSTLFCAAPPGLFHAGVDSLDLLDQVDSI